MRIMKRQLDEQPSDYVEAMAGAESAISRLEETIPKLDVFIEVCEALRETLQAIRELNENDLNEQEMKML